MDSRSLGRRLWRLLPTAREKAKTLATLAKASGTSVAVARTYVRAWVAKGAVGEWTSQRNPRQKVFWRLQSEYLSASRSPSTFGKAVFLDGLSVIGPSEGAPELPSHTIGFHLVTGSTLQARRYRPLQEPQDAPRLMALVFEPLAVAIHASVHPLHAAALLRRVADALELWPGALGHLPATVNCVIEEDGQVNFDLARGATAQDEADLNRWTSEDQYGQGSRGLPGPSEQIRQDPDPTQESLE